MKPKQEETPNELVKRVRQWTPTVVRELVSRYSGVPLAYDLVEAATNLLRHTPRVLTKDGLYKRGLTMLKRASNSIVVVNTVTKEDAQNYVLDWGHPYQKQYFEELFRIVQKNRHDIGTPLHIMRFTDLNDVQKCEEAISLLLYGSNVEIYDSAIPIEFLIRDTEEVLLGFPENDELSHGVQLKRSKNVCATLNKWIMDQTSSIHSVPPEPVREAESGAVVEVKYSSPPTPSGGGFTDAQAIAQRIREKRQVNKKVIGDHSLLHAMDLLAKMNVDNPISATQQAFDEFYDWYPNLYDENKCEYPYKALANYVKKLTLKGNPTFLDVGCAHGLGSEFLDMEGVEYWGIDVSTVLIEKAQHKLLHRSKNFMVGDMVKLLLKPGMSRYFDVSRRGSSSPLPNKVDVIACQGNAFDFFLGDLQKWFALTLFKSRLKERGLLFLTQRSFAKTESRVERKLPAPGGTVDTIVYNLEWSGDFVKLDVQIEDKPIGSVIQHPTDPAWLQRTCVNVGFKAIDTKHDLPEWFGPRGGKPYQVFAFQLAQ